MLVSVLDDATMALLALVDETTEDLIDLFADMRIAGPCVKPLEHRGRCGRERSRPPQHVPG